MKGLEGFKGLGKGMTYFEGRDEWRWRDLMEAIVGNWESGSQMRRVIRRHKGNSSLINSREAVRSVTLSRLRNNCVYLVESVGNRVCMQVHTSGRNL